MKLSNNRSGLWTDSLGLSSTFFLSCTVSSMVASGYTLNLGGFLHPQLPEGLRLPYGMPAFPLQIPIPLQIPPPAPGGETPRSSAFPFASLPLYPRSPCDGGGKAYKKD
ncbi:hypothetical protein PoB_005391200 [Plakobranchus ocellatus]|uniref:Uncharacterized protein n=1 Tax=Plakobranchus ocellatus TaxID=259542 RepID=A0AAV4C7Z0_9GAST|nr:hypothetical protein PoB_005391200 [Plakobranchus ocellatus]